ncbi:DUF2190 family protein [Roseomonas nepalensis]|uniref:DUF2190 family protein n=1 Tax=Muricoccus nepalensis TaxID=1854500 RepID=A0A502FUZ1_9PROT|nr:DUF2190 family protein [Roseomonas nepalensis]TPG53264.1 DUF2190 family protein [Roseomonas nepalensis]
MQNFVQVGEQLRFTAAADLASGAGVVLGSLFGVNTYAVAAGQDGVARIEGVVRLPKAAGAVTQFAKVYWDDTAKNVTTTATANRLIGAATRAEIAGATTVEVRLDGKAV